MAAREALPPALERFLRGEQDPRTFTHADHVRVAYEILSRHSFLSSARIFSRRLRAMTMRIGRPDVYNETITLAFLSLIAEKLAAKRYDSFEAFAAGNPELMSKSVLSRWYTPERLRSDIARRTFVLPEPSAGNAAR